MMRHMGEPVCSVVIPAYNAARTIEQQLSALAHQRTSRVFEVVVVDNRSTDDTRAVVDRFAARTDIGVRLVDASERQGAAHARNVGVRAARADLILGCDADDEVGQGWVGALVAALERVDFAGGPLETQHLNDAGAEWLGMPAVTTDHPKMWGVRYPISCNFAFCRRVFDDVGGFDESFTAAAEEVDFAWRAHELGYRPAFIPDAVVHYRIRSAARSVLRQQYQAGMGVAQMYAKHRPESVRTKSWKGRLRHDAILVRDFPVRGSRTEQLQHLGLLAFEAGKLRRARDLGVPAP